MKTLLSLLIVLFLVVSNLPAQGLTLNYGLSVGYSKRTPNFNIPTSQFYIYEIANDFTNFNVTAILEFASSTSNFRFQTGLKYFRIGYSRDIHPHPDFAYFVPPPKRDGANYSYLAIPIKINYFLPFVSGVYLSGGIESVYLVSGNSFIEFADGQIREQDIKGGSKNQFFMYTVGIGFEYKIDVVSLFIEPEYSHSFDSSPTSPSIIGEQISLYVGIKY